LALLRFQNKIKAVHSNGRPLRLNVAQIGWTATTYSVEFTDHGAQGVPGNIAGPITLATKWRSDHLTDRL
jgi:hypothetical protein